MRLRYAGSCSLCGQALSAGTTADYDRIAKTVACVACPASSPVVEVVPPVTEPLATEPPATPSELAAAPAEPASAPAESASVLGVVDGHGGASAAAEFQRRHDARQERVLNAHPRLGRFLLAVFDDPQSTRAWSIGAEGERVVAERLARIAGDSLRVLNDRGIPGSKANIDHIVVCRSGVFVVDPKRYRNARPERRVEGGLIRPRTELLIVGGRDRSALVDGVTRQVARVRATLADVPGVPVRGVLCFVDADWPLFANEFSVNDVAVVSPRKLTALLTQPGDLEPELIAELQWRLHEAYPRHG